MPVKFLFMDEKFARPGSRGRAKVTALAGVLIPAHIHSEVRSRYYRLLAELTGSNGGTISWLPVIHASNLLPEYDDEVRIRFLREIVEIVISFNLRIYRVAYGHGRFLSEVMHNEEKDLLGLCFLGMLSVIKSELEYSQIWPVMEMDGSKIQERNFSRLIQQVDYLSEIDSIRDSITVDNANLGEVLYSNKKSAHGSIVDIVSYLRDLLYMRQIGEELTPFKEKLASLGEDLNAAVSFDEVIWLKYSAASDA